MPFWHRQPSPHSPWILRPCFPLHPLLPLLPPSSPRHTPQPSPLLQPPTLSTLPQLVPSRHDTRCRVMSPPCSANPCGPCHVGARDHMLVFQVASSRNRLAFSLPLSLRVHFEEGFHLLPQVALDEPCKFPPLTLTHGLPLCRCLEHAGACLTLPLSMPPHIIPHHLTAGAPPLRTVR